MTLSIAFTVLGTPAPKGSSRAMTTKTGQAVNVPSGSTANKFALADWGGAVRAVAAAAVERWYQERDLASGTVSPRGVMFGDLPVRLRIEFRMRRTKGHYKKNGELKPDAERWHATKPDVSKLVRSTEDAMIGTVLLDDSRVAELLVRKIYAAPGQEGAWISVEALP